MKCLKCQKSLPEIEGMVNCPFCGFRLDGTRIHISDKFTVYRSIHFEMAKDMHFSYTDVSAIAADIARAKFNVAKIRPNGGRPVTKKISMCDDAVIEYWHKLCIDIIGFIKDKTQT